MRDDIHFPCVFLELIKLLPSQGVNEIYSAALGRIVLLSDKMGKQKIFLSLSL